MISKEKQDSNNYSLIAITALTTTALLTGGTYLICNIKPQLCPPMFKAQSKTLALTASSTANTALIKLNEAVINGLQKSLSKENLVSSILVTASETILDLFPDRIENVISNDNSISTIVDGLVNETPNNNGESADILTPTRQHSESISAHSNDDATISTRQHSESISADSNDDATTSTRQHSESISADSDNDVTTSTRQRAESISVDSNDKVLTSTKVVEYQRMDSIDEALGIDHVDLVDSCSNSASNSPHTTDIIVPNNSLNGLNEYPMNNLAGETYSSTELENNADI